jgi:hypothetical protein
MGTREGYRTEAAEAIDDASWTIRRGWGLVLSITFLFLFIGAVAWGANALGYWGSMHVERKVFEASPQRSESFKARIATEEATLVEINAMLEDPTLDAATRRNLEVQKRAVNARINAAKAQQ